jgi:hypothetical protein
MSNERFAPLAQAYHQRAAGIAHACAGPAPVVGYVGPTVPVELLHACGVRAMRLAPAFGSTALADPYVEAFADPDARLLFAEHLAGVHDHLALLVVPRSSETWHKLYLALREARRSGLKASGPPLWLHDVPHTLRDSSRAYGLARTQALATRCAALGGRSTAEVAAALPAAIAQGNATRGLLQGLQALRLDGRVRGEQAQVATGALAFLPPAEGHAALAAWLAGQANAPATPRPRLFVQGVPLDHAELHRLVDEAGATVVEEDDAWGSRAATPLIATDTDPLHAVFDHYWRHVPCARLHPPPPGPPPFVTAHRAGRVHGLLFNLPEPDDVHGWRLPAQRAAADAAGLAWRLLRQDARSPAHLPALREALAGLVQQLASRP